MEKSDKGGSQGFHNQTAQRKADNKMKENWLAVQRKKEETSDLENSSFADEFSGPAQLQEAESPIQRQENKSPNTTGMPDQLKSGIENLSGQSMDDVKVHYNSSMPAQLQAHAYAQGTDIHLASGQEKHLPHEAWHVVQQKEGRVKPTKQLKGANINDDSTLEKEADVMGAKAMQMKSNDSGSNTAQLKSNGSADKVVQRYAIAQDQLSNEIYNKSLNGDFVVGLGYPNHELYINDTSVLANLNTRIEYGLLEFYSPSQKNFNFGEDDVTYYKVMPRHKSDGDYEVDQQHLNEGIKKSLVENQAYWEGKSQNNFDPKEFEKNFDYETKKNEFTTNSESSTNVYDFSMATEFIRKSFSQLGYTDSDNDGLMEHKDRFVSTYTIINKYLKGVKTDKAAVIQAIKEFQEALPNEPENLLLQKIKTKTVDLRSKANDIPDTSTANLLRKGHLNHQFNALENDKFLLPRGCDLVAGTTMGVESNESSQGSFAMKFNMRGNIKGEENDHFHFSTKLLADSTDFVTIEGFAKRGYNIFDDTWEFFLHGNKNTEKESFNAYTMSRYDFFDFKAPFMEEYNKDPKGLILGPQKLMEPAITKAAMDFYNTHIVKGGGQATLKDKDDRDTAERKRLKNVATNRALACLNNFPTKADCVPDDPDVNTFKNEGLEKIFDPTLTTQEQVNRYLLHAFDNMLSTLVSNHMDKAKSIAKARSVFDVSQDENYFTRIQAWIDECTTQKDGLSSHQLIAKSKYNTSINELTAIKNKFTEFRNYRGQYF
ncbi:eCIS core domain-containing protein [Aureibacter tunicatorum]|uniref:eCIS core domain-containing protein n=1 Tax=Aureibacter tunicatorum TaxID=866807 RepID=A0AAE3XK40_9BACT|nr:DUF4157 domain-containing protein [Aureibacter tunicatorum]MDR6237464.1 hypothetical protein [Aureibacter tunicatorum]BDD06453.1 hypothetical protein AUTU_39360 [Aureibacter tunicatorum]